MVRIGGSRLLTISRTSAINPRMSVNQVVAGSPLVFSSGLGIEHFWREGGLSDALDWRYDCWSRPFIADSFPISYVIWNQEDGRMAREVSEVRATDATPAVADPAPLGLAGFALTTVLLSGFNAGLINGGNPAKVGSLVFLGMALFYGGLAQFMAGMWEFKNKNTFGATAFGSFGAFWMGVGILFVFDVVAKSPLVFFGGQGAIWFFFCWAVFTTYMWVASLRTNGAVMLVFLLLAATFWALWGGTLGSDAFGHGWTKIGGYLGLATAIVAFYASFAGVINSTFGKVVAPVFPLTRNP